jgi:hypothetical protein
MSMYRDSMGPVLERAIPKSVTDCVVDGEMMAVDLATGRFLAFGEKRPSHGHCGNGNGKGGNGRKGMGRSAGCGGNGGWSGAPGAGEGTEGEHAPYGSRDVFVAFDLLWLNGRCLAGEPLHERRRLLRENFHFEDHHFELVSQTIIPKDIDKGTQRVSGRKGRRARSLDTARVAGGRCLQQVISKDVDLGVQQVRRGLARGRGGSETAARCF